MSQNIIKVENQDGILVVDSRLIATRIDIDHRSFLKTVRKYQSQVEKRFGAVRFEITTREDGNSGGNQPTFAWLTKPQSEAYMTFSRNTDEVVECKLDLVQAFNEAEQASQQPQQPAVKDELDIISLCLTTAGLDPKLTAGVMLNHAGVRMPQLKGAIAEGHQLLAASLESDLLLTPTKIGKELGVSGRRINQILLDLGYQVKNLSKSSKTEPDYLVTEIGKPYSGNTLATGKLQDGKPDNSTYQHLKWKQEVIEVIKEHLID